MRFAITPLQVCQAWLWLMVVVLLTLSATSFAATPPGTLIRTQANASFLDVAGGLAFVSSNEIITQVQPVTGVQLSTKQHFWGSLGEILVFPHLLTNTGNIPADYLLDSETSPYVKTTLYIDKDHSGQPDDDNKVKGSVNLLPGESLNLLIEGKVPDIDYTNVILSARVDRPECLTSVGESSASGRCQARVSNQMSRSLGVVYNVTKSMDRDTAYVGDKVEITVSFQRLDNRSYDSKLILSDHLPGELSYITGSSQLCSYQQFNCNTISDPDIKEGTLIYKLTSKGNQEDKQHRAHVRFTAGVVSGVDHTVYNVTEYTFCEQDKDCPEVLQESNYVPLYIKGYGVSLNGSPYTSISDQAEPVIVPLARAGTVVEFANYLWNVGTEMTTYRLSLSTVNNGFPTGSLYCLDTGDGCSGFVADPPPVDIDNLEIRNNIEVRLKVQLPLNINVGDISESGYSAVLDVVDVNRADQVFDNVRNWLLNILPAASDASVDLTLDQPLGTGPPPPGSGPGPEASPLLTLSGQPGETLVLDNIFINNTGGGPDSYRLAMVPKTGVTLPAGLFWQFLNANNVPITHSVTLPVSGSEKVKLTIAIPEDAVPGSASLRVRAVSGSRDSEDYLHLALSVTAAASHLTLAPVGLAQVLPGSVTWFVHQLMNHSAVAIDTVHLQLSDTLASSGWQSRVYQDLDGDGQLSAGDLPVADIAPLLPTETRNLLVQVFAPANAFLGSRNITTLTASWKDPAGKGKSLSVSITDTALVNDARVVITKQQAPWDCRSTLPALFSGSPFPAPPESCIVYKLMAVNQGAEPVQNLIIHDMAPPFTRFVTGSGLPAAEGVLTGTITVLDQTISAQWLQAIAPGETVSLMFGIRIY